MNDTKHKTLDVELLNIHKGEYLSEALKRQGYPMLPSNAIINKVMTGTGATYMELNAKLSPRNSIVIEPYRSAVENKVQVSEMPDRRCGRHWTELFQRKMPWKVLRQKKCISVDFWIMKGWCVRKRTISEI